MIDPAYRYALALLVSTVASLVLLIFNNADASKWLFVVLTILMNIVLWFEAAYIVASLYFSADSKWHVERPKGIVTLLVFLFLMTEIFVNTLTCLAQFDPARHITALDNDESRVAMWLRIWNMIVVLFGPGGYGRYFPVTLGARVLIGYALASKLFFFFFVVNSVVATVAERYQAHVSLKKRLFGSSELARSVARVLNAPNAIDIRLLVYLGMFMVGNVACLAICSSSPMRSTGNVVYSVMTCVACVTLAVEFALSVASRFSVYVEFKRRAPGSWYTALMSLAFFVLVYSMIFSAFALYSPSTFFTNVKDSIQPFELWASMIVVALVFMVPGGYGLEVSNSLHLEVVICVMVLAWVMMLILVLESLVSTAQERAHASEHKHSQPAQQ